MSIVPPASASLVWAFPTPFEEVRCFVWEHSPEGWSIAIMFGDEIARARSGADALGAWRPASS